ncbi:MAG: tetratricopeptide repeat protein [Candidatus Omnitrophota bacterium]|nr:MAG: tetratricopeptide repeat protein [Candidatus Omnitrophota bacterium]
MYKKYIPLIVIAIVGFAVYGNCLRGEFIWDDEKLVKNNIYIKHPSYFSTIFTEEIGSGPVIEYHFYRPLQMLSYLFDYSLWKLNVVGYHLTNILLHIAVALAFFWLIMLLFGDKLLSFISSLLFVIHPIHTEAVSYISGRADSLAALFMFLCYIFYVKHLEKQNRLIFSLIITSYICALLSRESSLILPVLLLLYHSTFRTRVRPSQFVPLLGVALIYIILRFTVLSSILPWAQVSSTFFQRLPGFFVALTNYLKLLIIPLPLHMEYGNNIFSFTDLRALLGIILALVLFAIAYRTRKKNQLVFFSIGWFFIALAPQSNLYPINAYMAEHWLYLPSMGFFLLVGRFFTVSYKREKFKFATITLIIALISFLSALTIKQNTYWRNALKFYERTLEYSPQSLKILNNLAIAYHVLGKYEKTVMLSKKAIDIDSADPRAYNNLGSAYRDLGKYNEAIAAYKKAIVLRPSFVEAYNNLGILYNERGSTAEAKVFLQKAIEINPQYAETYYNLGLTQHRLGQHQEAIDLYRKAIKMNPDLLDAYNNLGTLYAQSNRFKEAIAVFQKAKRINPRHSEIYYNLGKTYTLAARYQDAITSYGEALIFNPEYAEVYNNLANVYRTIGKIKEAIPFYKKAIQIDPDYEQAYYNLGLAYYDIDNYQEAIVANRKALDLNPNYSEAHNNLAAAYYYAEEYDLAIKHCDKAIELGYRVSPQFIEMLKPYRKSSK